MDRCSKLYDQLAKFEWDTHTKIKADSKRTRLLSIELLRESIKSKVTPDSWVDYVHAYMRHHLMYDGEKYHYGLLAEGNIQEKLVHFVVCKKKKGLGYSGISNYVNALKQLYWVNGIKGIDWELVRTFLPENVKKTNDREYYPDEVLAIEDKLDVRGKVVSGAMRGSGIRRGAEPTVSVGDLFARQTPYGKIYKIWVYRGTSDMYPTACIPEVAVRIGAYFEYRLRFGERCRQYGKPHTHEYHDGEEVTRVQYTADDIHLDPSAPLIREDFDRKDSLQARRPKRISYQQISDIIRDAAIAAGVRVVNGGDPYTRHKVMITHGFRKLFKKRCRQSKVDPIILERLLGHRSGNPKDGITKLMMTYDPVDWEEMQAEFEKAIPNLTITKDAIVQVELEKVKQQLKNVPTIEQLQADLKKEREERQQLYEQLYAKGIIKKEETM